MQLPLPRLQSSSGESVTFHYAINWTQSVRQPDVRRYQRGEGGPFDNRIHLRPGVGEALVRLNHLLRPLIHHQWAVKVATLNRLDEYQLERFLFGAERVPLERVRGPIIELQEGRCFYCAERLASRAAGRRTWTTSSRGRATPTTASRTWSSRTRAATRRSATSSPRRRTSATGARGCDPARP